MIRVFIGYDPRESVAYHVLSQSILEQSSQPVTITPIALANLPMFTRRRDPYQATDFSFSRFLVPYLCGYEGHAIFMDCDILCRGDIADLWRVGRASRADVSVVKHEYIPSTQTKFLGLRQTMYPCKNWSSVMVFNCAECRVLDLVTVNEASGAFLHQFEWTDMIGDLPPEWNFLVGEAQPAVVPKLVHFTLGGPWFSGYETVDYAQEWFDCKQRMEKVIDHREN